MHNNLDDECQSSQSETLANNLCFRFGPEQCLLLVRKRIELENVFKSRQEPRNKCWQIVVDKLGWKGMVTAVQVKKKWENCVQQYRSWKKGPTDNVNQEKRRLKKSPQYMEDLDGYFTNKPSHDVDHVANFDTRPPPQETIMFNYEDDDDSSEPVQIEIRCENDAGKASQIAKDLDKMLTQSGRWKRKRQDFEVDKEFKQYLARSTEFQKRVESRLETMADSLDRYTKFMMASQSGRNMGTKTYSRKSHPVNTDDDITIIRTEHTLHPIPPNRTY